MDVFAVNDQDVIFGLVGGGFFGGDRAVEASLGGIIFEQISEVIGGNDIANRNNFNVFAHEALFDHRAEDQPPDAAKTINSNFHSHTISISDFRLNTPIKSDTLRRHPERSTGIPERFPNELAAVEL